MLTRIKKRFDIPILEANSSNSKTFDLDKTVTKIHGILFTADRDDLIYYRGSQKVEINRQEVFPEGYESKLLLSGINVAPNDRYYDLGGIEPGNGKVLVDYRDNENGLLQFTPYRISIYLDLEIVDLP